MGRWIVFVSELRCNRWVSTLTKRVPEGRSDQSCRKQARRTGMAGPLGEMFDHGKKQPMLLYDL